MMTQEQIEKIAESCGVIVSYGDAGRGGFIVDETKTVYKSLNDLFMESFIIESRSRKMYYPFDENTFLAA